MNCNNLKEDRICYSQQILTPSFLQIRHSFKSSFLTPFHMRGEYKGYSYDLMIDGIATVNKS